MEEMEPIEIHLNRRSINAVEAPHQVEVETGSNLVLRLINHKTPVHVTISSSNSAMFTNFFHENLYVQDVLDFPIPIREEAFSGFFDINIITGYGTKKSTFRAFVQKAPIPEKPEGEPSPDLDKPVSRIERLPSPPADAWLVFFLLVIAAICYGAWLFYQNDLLNYMAFVAVLAGVIVAWSYQR